MDLSTIEFDISKDIDLRHIFECGQCFRWNASEDGGYVGVASGHACRATYDGGKLELDVSGGDRDFWYDYFDLGTDYSVIKSRLVTDDDRIADAVESGSGIRILDQDFFEVLISFIISQNNNIPRIKKCIEGLAGRFGETAGFFAGKERYAFPTPERLACVTEDELAPLKLGYRAGYIARAAKQYMTEGMPEGTADEKMKQLLSYYGIGPKVANCILLFGSREFGAFPIDVWMRKVMHDVYGFEESDLKGMQAFAAEKFGGLGGYAQQYLFYYCRG